MTQYTMTTKEAAKLIGVTPVTVQQAIIYGVIPAEKRMAPTPYGERMTYFIDPTDIPSYVQYRNRRNPPVTWTAGMDAAIFELRKTCTLSEVAAYLGVSRSCVKYRVRKIGASVGHRDMSPFHVPITGLLLAKTCTDCGELLGADRFYSCGRRRSGSAQCNKCLNRKEWKRDRTKDSRRELNRRTAEKAHRHRAEWTTADDEYLTEHNETKSAYQLALDLGRTMDAVQHRRKAIGLASPVVQVDQKKSRWNIDFPATQEEVEAYFKSLRRVVPEDQWEWDEKEH